MRSHPFLLLVSCILLGGACSGPRHEDGGAMESSTVDPTDAFARVDSARSGDAGHPCFPNGGNYSDRMQLTLGTSSDGTYEGFAPLGPQSSLWITPGAQGLQHLVVAFRGRDFNPAGPLVQVSVARESDCEPVGSLSVRTYFSVDPEDSSLLATAGLRVTLDDYRDPTEFCSLIGQRAVIVADVTDTEGRSAHREVVVFIPGIDPAVNPTLRDAWQALCARRDGAAAETDATAIDAP